MRTRTWLILGGLLIGVLLIWLALEQFSSGVPVKAARAKTDRIREFVDERATTRLPVTYLITMPYNGRIEPITLVEGTPVNRGDPVAQIVPQDLDLDLDEAMAGFGAAEASVDENADNSVEETAVEQTLKLVLSMKASTAAAAAQVQAADAGLKYAESDLKRTRRLHDTGARSDDELEQAILRRNQRAAEYPQAVEMHKAMKWLDLATDLMPQMVRQYIARKGLTGTALKEQETQAGVRLRQAMLNYRRGTMSSPVDGSVLNRHVTNERVLSAGTVLLEIGRLEDLEVEADVLSLDAVRVREGDAVEIYGPAIGKRRADGKDHAEGKVHQTYPAGFTKISSLGVEQQRVKVIVRIDPKDLEWLREERKLGVGYRVRVRIVTAEKPKARVVPRSALFRGTGGNWQLYAIDNGRARIREVQVGLMNDEWAEITQGLSEGEQVILAPESNLTQGTRVAVEKKEKK